MCSLSPKWALGAATSPAAILAIVKTFTAELHLQMMVCVVLWINELNDAGFGTVQHLMCQQLQTLIDENWQGRISKSFREAQRQMILRLRMR